MTFESFFVLFINFLHQSLVFGDMSGSPIEDLAVVLDEVLYPMLSNPDNQVGWPEIIKKDVDSHFQELRNVIAEVSRCIMND